jgi:hypothetical protein
VNNSGSVFDVIFIMGVLLCGVVGLFLSYTFISKVLEMNPFQGDTNSTQILTIGRDALKMFDYIFVIVAFGLSLAAIAMAFLVRSHPAFFIATWLALVFTVFFGIIFGNLYYAFATSEAMVSAANQFPLIYTIFSNLPTFALVVSAAIAIVIHAKSYGGVGY